MIKKFRGQVKVSDVQEAFDYLLDRINGAIDSYNAALDVYNVDFNIVNAKIGSKNQTLSVGALKKILDAYNNTILGCQAFKVTDTKLLISGGIYIKDRTVYKLPTKTVTIDSNTVAIYFNPTNNTYSKASGSGLIEVCRVNTTRFTPYCNTPKTLTENFSQWSMKVEDKAIGSENNQTFTTSSGKFIGGVAGRNGCMSLLGDKDSSNRETSYHDWSWRGSSDSYWEPFNYLWVPKGLTNPYVYHPARNLSSETRFKSEHVWNEVTEYSDD